MFIYGHDISVMCEIPCPTMVEMSLVNHRGQTLCHRVVDDPVMSFTCYNIHTTYSTKKCIGVQISIKKALKQHTIELYYVMTVEDHQHEQYKNVNKSTFHYGLYII